MKQEESALKEDWTSSWRTLVGAAGDLKVVDSFKCPHCPDKCDPFTDIRALNNHIKWDHTLKHLLYEEEEVVNQLNGLAVEDSAGNSAGSSGSSGTYYTAIESGEGHKE